MGWLLTSDLKTETDFLALQPAERRLRHEAPNLETEYVIMCCVVRAISHFRGR
jgi:hypothetical protein